MNLEDLLKERLIERVEINKELVKNTFELAERDIKAAKDNLKNENFDWCYAIAYNAMLQAGRALMFSKGFRSTREGGHIAVVRFVATLLVGDGSILVTVFNKLRVKRHQIIYEQKELVSKEEAVRAVDKAVEFIGKIKKMPGW